MKNELREKGSGADRAADAYRSRHAVLRCLAGRGGDSAEQSNQIMSGVCGHWVKSFRRFTDNVPLPGLDSGGGDAADQPASPNFLKGGLYQGREDRLRAGAELLLLSVGVWYCPIGAFQAVVGLQFSFSYYIIGFLILLGVLLGRFICGFLCPFGWFQEPPHKIPLRSFPQRG